MTFEFANFQSPTPVVIDNIGATSERANGTAVLRISYLDGSYEEGLKTSDTVQAPAGGVDPYRTIFHVNG